MMAGGCGGREELRCDIVGEGGEYGEYEREKEKRKDVRYL